MAFPEMDYETRTCLACGRKRRDGDWPGCPHGLLSGDETRSSYVPDEIPGGIIIENAGPEPLRFDSYTEMNAHFAAVGLQRKEKFSPIPGTDKDPAGVVDSRKYMDAQTLANGAALILRQQSTLTGKDELDVEGVLVNLTSHVMTESEAIERREQITQRREQRSDYEKTRNRR